MTKTYLVSARLILGAVFALAAWTAPASAVEGLTANATFTSNYVFRGISQSAADPAVQAGLDYDLGAAGLSGFTVGTWASSINFGDGSPFEWDLYGGYTGMLTDQLSWSVGAIAYTYPSATTNYNWQEVWGGLTYNFGLFSLTGKVFYSPDYVNLSASQIYYNGAISIPIASWLSLSGTVGYTDLDKEIPPLIHSYTDWSVGLAATYEAYTFTIGYADTDLQGIYHVGEGAFHTGEHFFAMIGFRFM